jgi:hypothetical protein
VVYNLPPNIPWGTPVKPDPLPEKLVAVTIPEAVVLPSALRTMLLLPLLGFLRLVVLMVDT